jgi:ubiquinone/menaquinone biosynthesis C-methylase UbiE
VTRISAVEGHRLWASVYDSGLNPILSLERRAMRSLLHPLRPTRVIDVACGTGDWLLHFQEVGSEVFGCDACDAMLNEASNRRSLRGRLVLADAGCIPFRREMADLVLCSLSLGYFPDICRIFSEFGAVAKAGALIAVSDLHPDALASGWTRSFKLDGQRYEIEHYRRSIREINSAAAGAGLRSKCFKEIYFGLPELAVFQKADREESFNKAVSVPALFLSLWKKPCC